jgi:quercetin dioxygenase-like cupin family protein
MELAPGVMLRAMWGDKVMMSMVEVAPRAVVPNHTHPHEQAGLVLQGEFEFTIGGETKRVRPGDAYVIPGGVEHSLVGSDGWSLVLDIFSPPREEYKH